MFSFDVRHPIFALSTSIFMLFPVLVKQLLKYISSNVCSIWFSLSFTYIELFREIIFSLLSFGYISVISCIEENEKAFPYCAVINDHKITYTENYRKIQTISVPFVSFNSDGTVFIGFEDNFTEQFGFYYKFGMEVDDFKKWLTW